MRLHHVQVACPRLTTLGHDVDLRERRTFPGFERFHAFDEVGNRVEVLSPRA